MGGGERRGGFVTDSAGLSGNALNDEPRVKKRKGEGGKKAADAELIVRADPWGFSPTRGSGVLSPPPVTDFISVFNQFDQMLGHL